MQDICVGQCQGSCFGRVKARGRDLNSKGTLPLELKIVPINYRSGTVDALQELPRCRWQGSSWCMCVLFSGTRGSKRDRSVDVILTPLATFMAMNHYGSSASMLSAGWRSRSPTADGPRWWWSRTRSTRLGAQRMSAGCGEP